MGDNAKKSDILEKEGFVYHFQRMIYINTKKKKVFSVRAIENNSPSWLIEKIYGTSITDDWQFYFIGTIDETIKHTILKEILTIT